MSRQRRPLPAVILVVIVAVISGCGSTAPADIGAGGSGANNTAANAQKAVKFATCMRSNGVSQFPDPSASGKLTIDAVANGSSLDPNSPAFKRAISACKTWSQPGSRAASGAPNSSRRRSSSPSASASTA